MADILQSTFSNLSWYSLTTHIYIYICVTPPGLVEFKRTKLQTVVKQRDAMHRVCLSVRLRICLLATFQEKTYEQIFMKFSGWVGHDTGTIWWCHAWLDYFALLRPGATEVCAPGTLLIHVKLSRAMRPLEEWTAFETIKSIAILSLKCGAPLRCRTEVTIPSSQAIRGIATGVRTAFYTKDNNRFHCFKRGPLKGPAWLGTASRNSRVIPSARQVEGGRHLGPAALNVMVVLFMLCWALT